jgi:phosphate transport system substrate-binding protein
MKFFIGAVVLAVLSPFGCFAQDVTLTSRDGALAIPGQLQSYDGEVFRVQSRYGLLTVDAAGVICDGPGCPDLKAPKAQIRILGEAALGQALLPPLIAAFAVSLGVDFSPMQPPENTATLTDPVTHQILAEISFQALPSSAAKQALKAGRAELMLSGLADADFGSKALALDALVPIVAPDNPLASISTLDLANALAGKVANWHEIGGPDMPLVLHGLKADSDLQRALTARLGRKLAGLTAHDSLQSLAQAVANDPWALAVIGRSAMGGAKQLPLTDSCGFPLRPSPLAIKAEDYPLTLPVYFLTPRRRLPLLARELLEFLALPSAQAAIAASGYVDHSPERQPLSADGTRLITALAHAGADTSLADLQRLATVMGQADRLSLTFRFRDGSNDLEPSAQDSLADLARLIEADSFRNMQLILAGFSDGSGSSAENLALSQRRAQAVLTALKPLIPTTAKLPSLAAFGAVLPIACDKTAAGRHLNRRVELWLQPAFASR